MNNPIIDVGGMGWTTIEDPSRSTLVNGNFEGAAGPAGWAAITSAMSRQPGARTGGSGSYVARVGWDGAAAHGYMYQFFAVPNVPYHLLGWYHGVNGGVPRVGGDGSLNAAVGTANPWQSFDVIATTSTAAFYLHCANLANTVYVEFDDFQAIPFINRTPNVGSLGGRLDMGNGINPPTLPSRTPNTTAGFSFNGSQYLQWMSPVTTNVFSYCALVMRTGAATAYLLDARAGGGAGRVYWDGANLQTDSGTLYVDDAAGNVLPYGQVKLVTCAGMTLSAPSKVVLQATNALATPWTGNVLGQVLVPGTLTPMQLRDVKNRLMARCWK